MIHCCCFTHPHKPVNKCFFSLGLFIFCPTTATSCLSVYLIMIISRDTNWTPHCSLLNRLKAVRLKEKKNLCSEACGLCCSCMVAVGGSRGHSDSNDSLRAKSERPTTEEKVRTSIMWSGWSGLLTVYSSHSLKPNIYLYNMPKSMRATRDNR